MNTKNDFVEVLFLCPHGAAKSVIAAMLFNDLAVRRGQRAHAHNAGTHPDARFAPQALVMLSVAGIAPPVGVPQHVSAEMIAEAEWVISIGCELGDLPGVPATLIEWQGVPAVSEAPMAAYDAIRERVTTLLDTIARS